MQASETKKWWRFVFGALTVFEIKGSKKTFKANAGGVEVDLVLDLRYEG
jgi:hypothetical protein